MHALRAAFLVCQTGCCSNGLSLSLLPLVEDPSLQRATLPDALINWTTVKPAVPVIWMVSPMSEAPK